MDASQNVEASMENAAFKKPRVLEKFEMTMTDQKIHHANEMVFSLTGHSGLPRFPRW